jgi:predicted nucleic acid-binding protein
MPAPHRAPASIVSTFLAERFPKAWLALPVKVQSLLVRKLSERGIIGGAVYDALVAETAAHHGATLQTLDGRAENPYRSLGVTYERLA